jgi:hypothetical protein
MDANFLEAVITAEEEFRHHRAIMFVFSSLNEHKQTNNQTSNNERLIK